MIYQWDPGMKSVLSGNSDVEEKKCQRMIVAGCEWLDKHPKATPSFNKIGNLYAEENQDAIDLSDVIIQAAGDECPGVLHQAAVSNILLIRKLGWKAYVKEMKRYSEG